MKQTLDNTSEPRTSLAVAQGWTAPTAIPCDVAKKIIAARDALIAGNTDEAYHQLYSIADPAFESFTPWATLEAQSNAADDLRPHLPDDQITKTAKGGR
jgi:hypothetical protein